MDIEAKYTAIKKTVTNLGGTANMVNIWKCRGKMPAGWKLKVFDKTDGAISLDAMDTVFSHFRNAKEGKA